MKKKTPVLRLPAVEVKQSPGRKLYSFAVDGKLVSQFASVSRVRRKDSGTLNGYQRPEVLKHINEIRNYLEGESPMVPNAVVVAFDSRVKFEPTPGGVSTDYSRPGVLVVPMLDENSEEERPGFIVDGQQRLAAIREASVASFPICVTAFVTNDVRQQTEQFILVNSTKPLPRGLIHELLPSTDARLPTQLARRRLPAYLLECLNLDLDSPLYKKIKTATNPAGVVKDNSILKMLEYSLAEGVLYRFKESRRGTPDVKLMLTVLKDYWSAVAITFAEAWGLPPKKSRLFHGAGVISMGIIMDHICDRHRGSGTPTQSQFVKELERLKPICKWTEGEWDFGANKRRKWNDLQNTPSDIELLANFLAGQYKNRSWARSA